MTGDLLAVCVSHTVPVVPRSWFDLPIYQGNQFRDEPTHVAHLAPGWDRLTDVAYGMAGTYAVPQLLLLAGLTPRWISLQNHRKAVVGNDIGTPSPTQPQYHEVDPDLAARLVPELRPRHGFDFLLPPVIRFQISVAEHYAAVHIGADLLEYLELGLELDVLTEEQASWLWNTNLLCVGGGELGTYPTEWIVPTLRRLSKLGRAFLAVNAERVRGYDPHQARCIAFLSERMGSALALWEVNRRYGGYPPEVFGRSVYHVPEGQHYTIEVVNELVTPGAGS